MLPLDAKKAAGGVESGVSDVDGSLCTVPSLSGDGDLDDSAETVPEGGLHFLSAEKEGGPGASCGHGS